MTTAKPPVSSNSPDWSEYMYAFQTEVDLPIAWDPQPNSPVSHREMVWPWAKLRVYDRGPNHVEIRVPPNPAVKSGWSSFYIDKARIIQLAKMIEVWSQ